MFLNPKSIFLWVKMSRQSIIDLEEIKDSHVWTLSSDWFVSRLSQRGLLLLLFLLFSPFLPPPPALLLFLFLLSFSSSCSFLLPHLLFLNLKHFQLNLLYILSDISFLPLSFFFSFTFFSQHQLWLGTCLHFLDFCSHMNCVAYGVFAYQIWIKILKILSWISAYVSRLQRALLT